MSEFLRTVEDVSELIRVTAVFPGVPAERVLAAFTVLAELASGGAAAR